MAEPINDGRDGAGRSAPGNRFGGSSRTGNRPAALLLLDGMAEEAAAEAVRAVIEKAKAGDLAAADILFRRVWPVRRSQPVTLPLPDLNTPGDVVGALSVVVTAMAEGTVTPEEAGAVAAVIEAQRRAIETNDLALRITALEERRTA
ncbi:hypothetical protein [Dankookia sp. P2]|uniref:hypothetical protein n=1 Tax=Dankookia sp. P2 TaxID=3423955 RepID=UPI003D6681DF